MPTPPVVLVVEDQAELRLVLKEALGGEGYQVLLARDQAEALELLRANAVDLLISDLTDPVDPSDGLDELRQEFPDLPVVAMSEAVGGHPALFFGASQGAGKYRSLARPFRLSELISVSREVLGSARGA